jgi:hypothetical protein
VPFNASYDFPTQANQTTKTLPRINPVGKSSFKGGDPVRIELPAVGYCNLAKSTLSFDVILRYKITNVEDCSIMRFQNDINCIFSRFRHLYGSSPFEDIQDYGRLSRCFTEWTASCHWDQSSIGAGIANSLMGCGGLPAGTLRLAKNQTYDIQTGFFSQFPVSARQSAIQGISLQKGLDAHYDPTKLINTVAFCDGNGWGAVPTFGRDYTGNPSSGKGIFDIAASNVTPETVKTVFTDAKNIEVRRRYCIPLNSGLATQAKLFPLKWMASQNVLEFTLANVAECVMFHQGFKFAAASLGSVGGPELVDYEVTEIVFQPEILEFDSSYDEEFLKGLSGDGIPILFSTFNTFYSNVQESARQVITIPERSRSVKSLFTVMSRSTPSIRTDSGATFYTSALNVAGGKSGSTLQSFQYQLGSRYYPAAPVVCSTTIGGKTSNGAGEAFIELSKALNTLGDYRLSIDANAISFATPPLICDVLTSVSNYISDFAVNVQGSEFAFLNEYDGRFMVVQNQDTERGSSMIAVECEAPRSGNVSTILGDNDYMGRVGFGTGSSCFAAAINLETSSGIEISGLNGEIATSLTLYMNYSTPQSNLMTYITWSYIDVMLILQANNVVTLIK